ncbi:MAG: peptide chain release factor N(5)-glutamine methyltransferase [Pseudonocardia sp.]
MREALRQATAALDVAGVASPRHDAEALAAHILAIPRGRLLLAPGLDPAAAAALRALVARRAAREPLQHLLGTAVLGGGPQVVEVAVGPGVFVPRPETELLVAWGLAALTGVASPLVLDLCTGSGAIALAVATARPDARVHAVERDPAALAWARRNLAGRAVLHEADVRAPDLLADLDGGLAAGADLLLCNPPYVPDATEVPPEVRHDPPVAVFGGADGLDIVRAVVVNAARLLRPGGAVAIEHDDSHGDAVPQLLRDHGFTQVTGQRDLAGRPRFATALLPSRTSGTLERSLHTRVPFVPTRPPRPRLAPRGP